MIEKWEEEVNMHDDPEMVLQKMAEFCRTERNIFLRIREGLNQAFVSKGGLDGFRRRKLSLPMRPTETIG